MRKRVVVAGKYPFAVFLQPVEEARPVDQPVFHHLRVTCPEFAVGQGGKRSRVGEHEARLVEGADKVLALRRVDGRLAADGAVHLGEQGGGYLHIIDAAQQDGRSEARKVAHDAAAERQDAAAAVEAGVQQPVQQVFEMAEGLGRLAGRQHDGRERDVRGVEPGRQPLQMVRGDILVRDDRNPAPLEHRAQVIARALHQARSGDDVVAAFAEADLDLPRPAHGWLPARSPSRWPAPRSTSSTWATVSSTGPAPLTTVRSASA